MSPSHLTLVNENLVQEANGENRHRDVNNENAPKITNGILK